MCKRLYVNIPYPQFDIEGEVFMVVVQDDDKPKTFSIISEEWINVMTEEMESMKTRT